MITSTEFSPSELARFSAAGLDESAFVALTCDMVINEQVPSSRQPIPVAGPNGVQVVDFLVIPTFVMVRTDLLAKVSRVMGPDGSPGVHPLAGMMPAHDVRLCVPKSALKWPEPPKLRLIEPANSVEGFDGDAKSD